MKNRKSSLIWGLIFIAAGVLYILDTFTGINIDIFDFWPLLLILPSIANMFSNGIRIGNSLFFLIGTSFLLTSLNIVDGNVMDKIFIPVCLIAIGLVILFKDKLIKNRIPKWVEEKYENGKYEGGSSNSYNAIFSSNKVMYPHDTFTGCDTSCVFGSVVLNLRDAIITEDTVVNCYCVFGGVDIHVPANTNIRISGTPIFGGVTNRTPDYENVNAPTLYINATTMFGGVTIK